MVAGHGTRQGVDLMWKGDEPAFERCDKTISLESISDLGRCYAIGDLVHSRARPVGIERPQPALPDEEDRSRCGQPNLAGRVTPYSMTIEDSADLARVLEVGPIAHRTVQLHLTPFVLLPQAHGGDIEIHEELFILLEDRLGELRGDVNDRAVVTRFVRRLESGTNRLCPEHLQLPLLGGTILLEFTQQCLFSEYLKITLLG